MQNEKMKVSVILTTYNGMSYLKPLLDSLRNQTKRIDEVLIYDDGSTDDTKNYIVQYIDFYKLTAWKICCNKENYGWMKNFKMGILACAGDIIFPCDQDDIWELNKIERMSDIMSNNEKIWLLSSDYNVLYEEGGKKTDEFTSNQTEVLLEQIKFDERFALHERPGCVMAVNRKLVEKIEYLWKDWYPHDAFLWTVANFFDGCYVLHEPLINYRRHDSNASTGSQHIGKAQINAMKRTLDIIEWSLMQLEDLSEEKKKIMNNYKKFAKLRIEFIQHKRVFNWFRLLRYSYFYRSRRQQFGDWYYIAK